MNTVSLLVRRELRSYFDTSWGWIILALVLVLDGLLFNALRWARASGIRRTSCRTSSTFRQGRP